MVNGSQVMISGQAGKAGHIILPSYHHTSDTLSLLTIVLAAWGHTLATGSDYTSMEVNL